MKYKLHIGCHRNTFTSRDSEVRFFASYKEAVSDYEESKNFWESKGYVVWFAYITSPDGSQKTLEENLY